jgi:hypothetical protein
LASRKLEALIRLGKHGLFLGTDAPPVSQGSFTRMKQTHGLECPHCREVSSVEAVLDASLISWPAHHWVHFQCPSCHGLSHVELQESQVRIGILDGAPGPCFVPSSSAGVAGLIVMSGEHGIEVRFAGRVWFIGSRR